MNDIEKLKLVRESFNTRQKLLETMRLTEILNAKDQNLSEMMSIILTETEYDAWKYKMQEMTSSMQMMTKQLMTA